MDQKGTARMFKALGDPTRLRIFQFLRSYCCATVGEGGDMRAFEGPTISEVCGHVAGDRKITTSMSFHLKELRHAGLIETEKRGKHVFCCVNRDALQALSAYLHEEPGQGGECC
jgi:ArsR family transcriptional regulator, arsenate/arsenite/antimonite-responsive transcriptional repressor